jgi:hypothetical protein
MGCIRDGCAKVYLRIKDRGRDLDHIPGSLPLTAWNADDEAAGRGDRDEDLVNGRRTAASSFFFSPNLKGILTKI